MTACALLGAIACGGGGEGAGSDAPPKLAQRAPVWVIGLDGADWRYLDRLMAKGAMPELSRLVREGRRGVLTTEQPPLSPLLWTTMMTGVSPLEHRILDFARLRPDDHRPEPITSSERRAPAIWNMASAGKRKVVVLGLFATHPAETVDGLIVADRFFAFLHRDEAPPGSVSPPERLAWAKERLQAAQASAANLAALRPYLPWIDEAELARLLRSPDQFVAPHAVLRRTLIETATYDALFRDAVAELDPDLAILYLQGTDSIGHGFARYVPPALPDSPAYHAARYAGVPEAFFRHVDSLLGAYRALAEKRGARLLLVSDHGFRWGDDRPHGLSPSAHNTAGRWHRDEGIWLLWGPDVRPGVGSNGGVRQVCATLLDLLDLPPGVGVAGPLLAADALPPRAASARTAVDYRKGYRPMTAGANAGEDGKAGGDEALASLRALGYAAGGNEPKPTAPAAGSATNDPTRTSASYDNEGLILRAAGRTAEARAAFEAALRAAPSDTSAAWNLYELLRDDPAENARADELLVQALGAWLPERGGALDVRARRYAAAGERDRALRLLERGLERLHDDPSTWSLRLLAGHLHLEAEQCAPALRELERAVALAPDRAEVHAAVGVAQLCLGDEAAAAAALRRSLALDPNQPQLRSRLAELGG